MRKSDKKIEKQLVSVLTEVCETALEEIKGFKWLTHTVNYTTFPQSLRVYCIFDQNINLTTFLTNKSHKNNLEKVLVSHLKTLNIHLKNTSSHFFYDSEENCDLEHNGNWAQRLH